MVSVIIPVHNAESSIARAVNSVFRQHGHALEVIVVDDGSTDNTPRILETLPVTVIRQRNQGAGAARNAGLKVAVGEFVAFLDADDEWLPGKLDRQLPILHSNPRIGLVSGGIAVYRDGLLEARSRFELSGDATQTLVFRNIIATSTVVFRRSLLERVSPWFHPELVVCQDWDFWLRMSPETEFVVCSDVVTKYHISGLTSLSRSHPVSRFRAMY
ncbi:MAG: glycosyltransferase family A protein, partial [Acidobacteria bacterium]|nr:glycosyltransferase family A protein [Acidobacteriota bacterium]